MHHFGTKDNLAAEVDALVVTKFRSAMTAGRSGTTPEEAAESIAEGLSTAIGDDPVLREYIRRSILEASPTGQSILEQIIDLTAHALRENAEPDLLPSGRQLAWLAVQITIINLAATLLEPLLEDVLHEEPFSAREVKRRTADNLAFITATLQRYIPESPDG